MQIEQLEAKARLNEKARLEYEEKVKEQRMKQEREINQLREMMRLEKEEQERRTIFPCLHIRAKSCLCLYFTVGIRWDRKQEENEFEIDQRKERAKLESTEIEKLRKDNEQLKRLREEERLKWEGKWSQEVEQHNNVGCVISPQGVMLVVRGFIDTTHRMKQQ